MRCTEELLKIKSKLILIHFTSFVEGQDLTTNQFIARYNPLRGNLLNHSHILFKEVT